MGKRLPSGAGASCLASTGNGEIGIATDAIFAVIVMVLLARKIWRTHGTLDVNKLDRAEGIMR
ncbi:hydrogenase 4 membrane subunit [Escherichia coli]|uniref:Hydrogenase 4 membrane subunit n=1 Tax=Escherichia coli TaxID=562 RepID=A0A376KQW9_ECOLX|nr:hydrogenase 4 membrane subunit [Escherichia coli]